MFTRRRSDSCKNGIKIKDKVFSRMGQKQRFMGIDKTTIKNTMILYYIKNKQS